MDISNDKSDSKIEETTDEYIRSTNPNDGEIEEEQNGNNANQNENILESEKNVKIRDSEDNILFNNLIIITIFNFYIKIYKRKNKYLKTKYIKMR